MTTKIITIANQKGGVGKSSTSVNLAHGLALKGYTTVLADFSSTPQTHLLLGLRSVLQDQLYNLLTNDLTNIRQEAEHFLVETGRENLWLLSGGEQIVGFDMAVFRQEYLISHIRSAFEGFDKFDYVVCDTQPMATMQSLILWAADHVIIPLRADRFSSESAHRLLDDLYALKRVDKWTGDVMGLLFNIVNDDAEIDRWAAGFNYPALPFVPAEPDYYKCIQAGKTLLEYLPDSRASQAYRQLVSLVQQV